MIQFNKLRISGFKSFVERTELEIAPGLNGVVGPNGCGKSNLVEALRWVMGENSAKRMRGGGMEDVIFNGTEKRTPRNIAEVSLLLDNSSRSAPAAYNNSDEIEITRKIERDHGSTYKINGKTVRARDVQMLFADTVTGANSPALVSQGRVTQIINSKPLDRRLILEESAGISGLYARRHEAELRLKAADNNLIRLEDILGGLEGRLNGLKRQSRQATRYRNIATQIRQLEVLVAWLEWQNLAQRMDSTRKKYEEAESTVSEKMTTVTQLTKTEATQAEELQPLRNKEAEIAASLQTQKLSLQRIEDEAERLALTLEETRQQLEQTDNDQKHEKQVSSEAAEALEKMEVEQKQLIERQKNEDGKIEEKQAIRDDLEQKVVVLEEKYTAIMQSAAESKARRASLEQQIAQNKERREKITERREKAQADLQEAESCNKDKNTIIELEKENNELNAKVEKLNKDIEGLQNELQKVRGKVNETRTLVNNAEAQASKLTAEIEMLEAFFQEDRGGFKPVLDDVTADSGFEKALSRALGDSLLASLDDDAPMLWQTRKSVKDMPALPASVEALLPHVKAPKELHLALSQIGIVSSQQEGDQHRENLLPGQALVSEDGIYWRWDGLCIKAEAKDRNAVRLEQKNKLAELEARKPKVDAAVTEAQKALETITGKQEELESALDTAQENLKQTSQEYSVSREKLSTFREQNARLDSEIKHLEDTIQVADEDIRTLEEVIRWDEDRLKAYEQDSEDKKDEDTEQLRQALSEAREAHQAAVRAFDVYQQEQNSRNARLQAIGDERVNMQNRVIRSRERLKQLEERQESLKEKLEELKSQPRDFEKGKEELLTKISALEDQRNEAAETLAAAELEVNETGKALKEAESRLGEARESRAHAQATFDALKEQQEGLRASVQEQFECAPEELKEHTSFDVEKNTDSLEDLRSKKEKLVRERDNIGPVNLRADEEAQELEKEFGGMISERDDLIQAISELREGINKINKEARERLISAFELVNKHFQDLFMRLYGGGQAHLALIDSDDPLGAGLEIFAQPPGKTLQSLSLLSGGEQTLASIALIFAMFLTNPSPICVLDEIDAPLDDANVDRVCDLLEEIAERGDTRFVIITHHRLTMARMDCLYGVTMAEKGVSQLVSVDLQQSFNFLEAA